VTQTPDFSIRLAKVREHSWRSRYSSPPNKQTKKKEAQMEQLTRHPLYLVYITTGLAVVEGLATAQRQTVVSQVLSFHLLMGQSMLRNTPNHAKRFPPLPGAVCLDGRLAWSFLPLHFLFAGLQATPLSHGHLLHTTEAHLTRDSF